MPKERQTSVKETLCKDAWNMCTSRCTEKCNPNPHRTTTWVHSPNVHGCSELTMGAQPKRAS